MLFNWFFFYQLVKLINSGGIFREPFLSHTVTLGHFISSKETAPWAFWKPQVEERWKSRSSWEWLGHPTPANEMSSHPWAGSATREELWLCRRWPPTYSPGSEWTGAPAESWGAWRKAGHAGNFVASFRLLWSPVCLPACAACCCGGRGLRMVHSPCAGERKIRIGPLGQLW